MREFGVHGCFVEVVGDVQGDEGVDQHSSGEEVAGLLRSHEPVEGLGPISQRSVRRPCLICSPRSGRESDPRQIGLVSLGVETLQAFEHQVEDRSAQIGGEDVLRVC